MKPSVCRANRSRFSSGFFVAVTTATFVAGMPALAQQTFSVDRLTDAGEGEGLIGDLRYCITNAIDGDAITFAVIGTINLTRALPELRQNISIEGPGANQLTVRRNLGGYYDIFRVTGGRIRISGLTVANGTGGIHNSADLILSACRISGNGGLPGSGGGIYNSGILAVSDSTIAANSLGDGVVFGYCGGATGAGVYNVGTLTINNSTISGNRAHCTLCVFDCYDIGQGGGVYNGGTLMISNSTVSNNFADYDSGIATERPRVLHMRNTILAGNDGSDLSGQLSSSGYNLIGDTRGGSGYGDTDLLNVNPLLGQLQDNGGPTFTHALLPGSPAIDAGDPDFIGPPDFDQRGDGFPRTANGRIDIGAFEVQAE